MLNKQSDNIQSWCTPFPILNQSIVLCLVLIVVPWPTYRFLRRQVRRSGIPIPFRIFHSLLSSTQSKAFCIQWALVTQLCPTFSEPMGCSLPGSSVHAILQGRILELVAISFSMGYSKPRDQTQVSHIAGRFFTVWATSQWIRSKNNLNLLIKFVFFKSKILERNFKKIMNINPSWWVSFDAKHNWHEE